MKRILQKAALAAGIVAAVWLVFLTPAPQSQVHAQGIVIHGNRGGYYSGYGQGYYGGYGQGYGSSWYGPGPGYSISVPGAYVYRERVDYGHSTLFNGYRRNSNYYGRVYYPYGYGGY